jgi:hypothetical protein
LLGIAAGSIFSNILLTSTGNLDDRDHKYLMKTWRDYHHIIETLPLDRLMDYLKVDPGSKWAAVDAIVCKADTDPEGGATYSLPRALKVAAEFRSLPESCAMRDGRKWKSIPFIVISEQPYYFGYPGEITRLKVALLRPSPLPTDILAKSLWSDRSDSLVVGYAVSGFEPQCRATSGKERS